MAAGAFLDFSPVLCAFQSQGRQVKDLAGLIIQGGFLGEVLPALTLQHGMNPDVLRAVAGLERATGVARLSARLAAGLLA
jgi:hypothetical protein